MNDKLAIFVGLVIGLAVLTFPFWYAFAAGSSADPPESELPEGKCVKDREFMRASHMDLLDDWRNAVVRDGETTYFSEHLDEEVEMSLTKTCLLQCHAASGAREVSSEAGSDSAAASGRAFCHACHSYAAVEPTCWECHVDP